RSGRSGHVDQGDNPRDRRAGPGLAAVPGRQSERSGVDRLTGHRAFHARKRPQPTATATAAKTYGDGEPPPGARVGAGPGPGSADRPRHRAVTTGRATFAGVSRWRIELGPRFHRSGAGSHEPEAQGPPT